MLGLQSYLEWSNTADVRQEAGLSKDSGEILEIDRCLSWFARHFSATARNKARLTIVEGFKRALTENYGQTIADLAWESVQVDRCGGLTAGLIKNASVKADRLAQIKSQLRPEDSSIPCSGRFEDRSLSRIVTAESRLGMWPATQEEAMAFSTEIKKAIADLDADTLASKEAKKLENDLKEQLKAKDAQVQKYVCCLPGGEAALAELAKGWRRALIDACARLTNDLRLRLLDWQSLSDRIVALLTKYDDRAMFRELQKNGKKLGKVLQTELNGCFKSEGLGALLRYEINGVRISDLVADSRQNLLNQGAWTPIRKEFTGTLDGTSFRLTSAITPGRHIDASIGESYDKEGHEDVIAFNSHYRKTCNAVNLATSELFEGSADGEPRMVFSGVRHGVHSAKGTISDQQSNVARAQQTVTAAFVEYLKRYGENVVTENGERKVIDFDLTSVSLLTPTRLGVGGEKKMLEDQTEAWKAIDDTELDVTVNGKTYCVKPHVLTFNYGVNAYSLSHNVRFGWTVSDRMNLDSLNKLRERVGAFQKSRKTGHDAVNTLWKQIDKIAARRDERRDGHEAYKMASRIAVLTYLMGGVPVWNCKSGKDRTGMLDVEAKFLATLIDRGQSIPEPGDPLTEEQQKLFTTIVLQSGNHEMQKYNTGVSGYRLKGVSSIRERVGIGDEQKKRTFIGGSGYVGS